MAEEITLERLKSMAQRRSLTLPEEQLQKLLPGVIRARRQAAELRDLLTRADEPAGAFKASRDDRK